MDGDEEGNDVEDEAEDGVEDVTAFSPTSGSAGRVARQDDTMKVREEQ